MNDKFTKIVQNERIKKGLSANALGKKAGISGRAITYWESGQREPSLESAHKVLKALGVTMVIGKEQ